MASDTNTNDTNTTESGTNGAKRGRKPGQTVVSKDYAFMLRMAEFDFETHCNAPDRGTMAWHMRICQDMLSVLRDDNADGGAIF